MMAWTDTHCRAFHRLLAPRARLYTEMVTAQAIAHGDRERLLGFDACEHPLALQVGGCEPRAMASAARAAAAFGYDEVNINVGCPSDRVQNGRFGACLMAEPERVADCVAAMRAATSLPVTVKTRIGIDHQDHYEFLAHFAATVAAAGCETLIVHARKAWLSGLSPKANREVPALDYPRVHRLKQDFPALAVVLNGGVTEAEVARAQLRQVDGVMIGRAAYQRPWSLTAFEQALFPGAAPPADRHAAIESYLPYVERALGRGAPLKALARPLLGLFHGCPGGRRWRQRLSETAHVPGAGIEVLTRALNEVPRQALRNAA